MILVRIDSFRNKINAYITKTVAERDKAGAKKRKPELVRFRFPGRKKGEPFAAI